MRNNATPIAHIADMVTAALLEEELSSLLNLFKKNSKWIILLEVYLLESAQWLIPMS